MGFLDLLKKLVKKEEKEIKIERIRFNNVNRWLEEKKKEIEKDNKEFLDLIKDRIDRLLVDLDEKISVLEEVDVNKIKSEARVKFIVKGNFEKYMEHVKKLRDCLEKLEANNVMKLVFNINDLFSNFQKKSSLNFQKATILIGKELGGIRDCIGVFLTDVKKIVDENKRFFDKTRILDSVEEKLAEKKKIEKLKLDVNRNVEEYCNKIENFEKEIGVIEKSIEDIKKAEDYIEKIKKREEIESKKEKLSKEIYNLKGMIDFKELARFFHINRKDMEIIKVHKENFREVFEKDNGKKIIQLLDESKLINNNITDKVKEILKVKKNVDNFVLEKDEIEALVEKIKKKKMEIKNLNIEKAKEKKRYEKFSKNIVNITDFIKDDLNEINVEIG